MRLRGGPERDLASFGGFKSVVFVGSFRREVYLRVLWTLALPRFVALITAASPPRLWSAPFIFWLGPNFRGWPRRYAASSRPGLKGPAGLALFGGDELGWGESRSPELCCLGVP